VNKEEIAAAPTRPICLMSADGGQLLAEPPGELLLGKVRRSRAAVVNSRKAARSVTTELSNTEFDDEVEEADDG
jgi:hypothetical protein